MKTEKEIKKKKFKYLYFSTVDEEAWLYINGKTLHEQTRESTGMLPSILWRIPFSVSPEGAKLCGKDILTVRVYNSAKMGGIWKPVHLILSNQSLTEQQIPALIGGN